MADVFPIPAEAQETQNPPVFQIPDEAKEAPQASNPPVFQIPDEAKDPFPIPAEAKATDQAMDLLNNSSVSDLAKNPNFRPTTFYNDYQKTLTPAQVDKLGKVYQQALQSPSRITVGGVVKSAGSGVASFVKGGARFLWDLPDIIFGDSPDAVQNNPEPGETSEHQQMRLKDAQDAQQAKAEALAGLESAATSTANLARTGIRKLTNVGVNWGEKLAGLPPEMRTPLNADINSPTTFGQAQDPTQRLISDAALEQQQQQTEQAKGPVAKAVGLDADTLAKQGTPPVDENAVKDLSSVENPVNYLPLGAGAGIANKAGEVLAQKGVQDAIEGAATGVGNVVAKGGSLVSKAGNLAEKAQGVAAIGEALSGSPLKAAAVYGAAPVLKTVGKVAQVAGKKIATSDLIAPVLTAGLKTAAGAAEGAAVSTPFALAQDYPEDQAGTLATGAALGTLGNAASRTKTFAVDKAQQAAENLVGSLYQNAPDTRPVADSPPYGTNPSLDAAHSAQMAQLQKTDPATANVVNRLRAALLSNGAQLYLLPKEEFAKQVGFSPDDPNLPWGSFKNNSKTVFLRQTGEGINAAFHEVGHAALSVMDPATKQQFFDAIRSAYTPDQIQKFTQEYQKNLGSQKPLSEDYVNNEMGAELLSGLLRGIPLDGQPAGIRRTATSLAAQFLEGIGLYQPDTVAGGPSPTVTQGGVKVSPSAISTVEPAVRSFLSKANVQPLQKGNVAPSSVASLPETVPMAPQPATPEPTIPPESLTPAHEEVLNKLTASQPPEVAAMLNSIRTKIQNGEPLTEEEQGIWKEWDEAAKQISEQKTPDDGTVVVQKGEKPVAGEPIPPAPEPKEAEPKNLRGITKKNYVPFTGPGRSNDEIGLTAAQQAVDNDKNMSDESKGAFKAIAENVRRPVQVVYRSAETAGDMSRTARRDETLSNGPGNARIDEGVGKVGVPIAFRVAKDGHAQVNLFSPDKVLANAQDLVQRATDAKANDLIPYENEGGKLTEAGQNAFNQDLENYLANQDNGYRGDGKKLVRPENPEGFIPAENPDYKPVALDPNKSDFINATMALKQPKTNRVQVNPVTKEPITPLNVKAAKIAKVNAREALKPGDITPKNASKQTYEDFGHTITEFNPLRKKLDERGVDTRELTEANEWVNAHDIKSAEPLPDNRLAAGAPLVTAAGFMPARGEVAVKMHDGRVFSGEDLYDARDKAIMAGGYRMQDIDNAEDGRLLGGKFTPTDHSKYQAEPAKSKGMFNKIWFTPDGKLNAIPGSDTLNLNGDYHNNWLRQNQPELQQKFGWPKKSDLSADEMRDTALKKGFVRVAYEPSGGRLSVEANENNFPKKVRDSILEYVGDHADNIDNVTVNLFNNKGDVTHNVSRRLLDMDKEEKLENLPFISDGHTAFMPASRPTFEEKVNPQNEEDSVHFMPSANEEVRDNAEGYMKEAGMKYNSHQDYAPINEPLAKRVADFYDNAKHAPNDEAVKKSYDAFAKETKAQWDYLTSHGVTMEPWTREGQPYANSEEMTKDVRDNNHLWFFPTESGYGEGKEVQSHPLLAKTGVEVDGHPLVVNDLFRAVHDYFGHAKEGYQFGPRGELNAFIAHSRMYSDEARPAMAAETMGQNSWVNFGKHLRDEAGRIPGKGEKGYVPPTARPFAEQKAFNLPKDMVDEATGEDHVAFMPSNGDAARLSELRAKENLTEDEQAEKSALEAKSKANNSREAWAGFEPERVTQAAVKLDNGKVFTGRAHFDAYDNAEKAGEKLSDTAQDGFVTSRGRFVDRKEAYELAKSAKQITDNSFHAAANKAGFGWEPDFVKNKELESVTFKRAQDDNNVAYMPSRKQGELHSQDLDLPTKFWLAKSGLAEDALGDHAKYAASQLGMKINNDTREQAVSKMMEKGAIRGERSSGSLFLDGTPLNFSDLSKAQRNRIEDYALRTKTPVYYNGEHIEGADDETVHFMPSKSPKAIKSAAIQTRDGEIFEGMYHSSAQAQAEHKLGRDLAPHDYVDGYVTNEGEFLDREKAYERAVKQKQFSPKDGVNEGMAYDQSGKTGMLESDSFKNLTAPAKVSDGEVKVPADADTTSISKNVAEQFMPAKKGVDLKDFVGRKAFVMTSDKMGIGFKDVGPTGAKRTMDVPAQGGPGYMFLKDGWAFSNEGAAKRLLSRVNEIAGDDGKAIIAVTTLTDYNHLKSPFGQLAYHDALKGAVDAGLVSQKQADRHIKEIFSRVKSTTGLHKEAQQVAGGIKSLADFKSAIDNRAINFELAKHYLTKMSQKELPIKAKHAEAMGISHAQVAKDIAEPDLEGSKLGTVVALMEIQANQKPEQSDFHFSYPWTVKAEPIGFLKKFHDVTDLTSDDRILVKGKPSPQPLMTVMPGLDKLEQGTVAFMPGRKNKGYDATEYWVGKGKLHPAPDGHEQWAVDKFGGEHSGGSDDNADQRYANYASAESEGYNRVLVLPQSIRVDYTRKFPTWESLPRSSKQALEDLSFEKNLPVYMEREEVIPKPRPDEDVPKFMPYRPQTEAGQALTERGFKFVSDFGSDNPSLRLETKKGKEVAQLHVSRMKDSVYVEAVQVNKDYRRQGIAEALYRELATRMQRMDITKLRGEIIHKAPDKIRAKLFGEPTRFDEDTGEIESKVDPSVRFMPKGDEKPETLDSKDVVPLKRVVVQPPSRKEKAHSE